MDKYLEQCWQPPPDLLNEQLFEPYPYHRHLVAVHGGQIDRILKNGCFGLFSSKRISPGEALNEDGDKDVPLGSSHHLFGTFVEFMSQRESFPNEKYDSEEVRHDFEEYVRDKRDDYEDEEFRRAVVLQLAERRFQKELDDEKAALKKDKKKSKPNSDSIQPAQPNSKVQKPDKASTTNEASKPSSQITVPAKSKETEPSTKTNTPNTNSKSVNTDTSNQKNNSKNNSTNKANATNASKNLSSVSSESSVAPNGNKSKKKNAQEAGCDVQVEVRTQTFQIGNKKNGESVMTKQITITKKCDCSHESHTPGNLTNATTRGGKDAGNSKKTAEGDKKSTGNSVEATEDGKKGTGNGVNSTSNNKEADRDGKNATEDGKKGTGNIVNSASSSSKKAGGDGKNTPEDSKESTGNGVNSTSNSKKAAKNSKKDGDKKGAGDAKASVDDKKGTAGSKKGAKVTEGKKSQPDKPTPPASSISNQKLGKAAAAGTTTSKGSAAELKVINKNISSIEKSIKEQQSLSLDGFRLMVETGALLMGGNTNEGKNSLNSCAQCRKNEEVAKSFKKCGQCKLENVKWARYYCSRECQVEDWVQSHREEHDKGLLVKK